MQKRNEKKIEKYLIKTETLLKGHFLLRSGMHSDIYYEKFKLFSEPFIFQKLIKLALSEIKKIHFDAILGPEKGGFFVAFEIARQLKKPAFYAEKKENEFVVRRGKKSKDRIKVLLVDDVITTGSSINKLYNSIMEIFEPVALFVLIDRRMQEINFPFPVLYLYKGSGNLFTPEKCPLCKENIELKKMGGT